MEHNHNHQHEPPASLKNLVFAMVINGGIVTFVGNGAATLLLQKISARNINMKSAWLHSLQDSLFSLG